MQPTCRFLILLCVLGFTIVPASGDDAPQTGRLTITLSAGTYRFVEEERGWTIEMSGFDQLREPGRPMLPEREALVLLPPGARAGSVEVEQIDTRNLPGRFVIVPTPPLLPLPAPAGASNLLLAELEEWERTYHSSYAVDTAYPRDAVRIVGAGSLRKYSYVRLAFRPFTYYAASGRLVVHDTARVRVLYTTPAPDSVEGRRTAELLRDTLADDRAERMFINFATLRDLYESAPPPGASPEKTLEHHDYVIITTPSLESAVSGSQFPAWKSTIGFDVRIVLTTDAEITGQPGTDLAEQIRNFLRDHYGPWGIEYVLLVGNTGVPMRYGYPDPANHLHDPSDPSGAPGSTPTDSYYADLSLADEFSWDLDRDGYHGEYGEDSPDFVTEVAVGRIPTDDASRVRYTLDKLVRVEKDFGVWKRNALHAGAVLFFANQDFTGLPFRDGAVCVDEIEQGFMQDWTVSRYSEQAGLVPSNHPWPALTLESFTTDWLNGSYGIVNWAGHGWTDAVGRTVWNWDDGDGVPETDGSDGISSETFIADWAAVDDDRPSIVCAVSCNVGYPEPNAWGNLGIDLLTDPALGAAAGVVSSSRVASVTWDWPAQPGGAESLCYEFNRYLIAGPGGPRRLGDALYESKAFAHLNYGWDHWAEYRNVYNYNLYGDPAMDWRGVGPRRGDLLRNTDVTLLQPVTPPIGDCLPLDAADDLYLPDFLAGEVDPDPAAGSPLVFYAIDAAVRIWLDKTGSGEIRIDF